MTYQIDLNTILQCLIDHYAWENNIPALTELSNIMKNHINTIDDEIKELQEDETVDNNPTTKDDGPAEC